MLRWKTAEEPVKPWAYGTKVSDLADVGEGHNDHNQRSAMAGTSIVVGYGYTIVGSEALHMGWL